jgi:uncharacterized protein (TIGR03435 family)
MSGKAAENRAAFTADGVHATDVTLLWVLHEAYGIGDNDLWSGGPAWLDKARFDIEAKYDVSQYPSLTPGQRQALLQQLLADRFEVVVHHEAKEFPLHALAIAKGGPKVEETRQEDLQSIPGIFKFARRGRWSHVRSSPISPPL